MRLGVKRSQVRILSPRHDKPLTNSGLRLLFLTASNTETHGAMPVLCWKRVSEEQSRTPLALILSDDFVTGDGGQGPPGVQFDIFFYKAARAIGHEHQDSP